MKENWFDIDFKKIIIKYIIIALIATGRYMVDGKLINDKSPQANYDDQFGFLQLIQKKKLKMRFQKKKKKIKIDLFA